MVNLNPSLGLTSLVSIEFIYNCLFVSICTILMIFRLYRTVNKAGATETSVAQYQLLHDVSRLGNEQDLDILYG